MESLLEKKKTAREPPAAILSPPKRLKTALSSPHPVTVPKEVASDHLELQPLPPLTWDLQETVEPLFSFSGFMVTEPGLAVIQRGLLTAVAQSVHQIEETDGSKGILIVRAYHRGMAKSPGNS